jgi:hypothetical protein
MANDYIKKEPTKTEKMLYELAMHQQSLEHNLFSNSMTILAVAKALGTDPKKIAKLLVDEEDKLKDLGKQINDEIDFLRKDKKPPEDAKGFEVKEEELT